MIWAPRSSPGERGGERAGEPLLGRLALRQPADEALARHAEDERAAEPVEQRQAVDQVEIVGRVLAEADAGIDGEVAARDAGGGAGREAHGKIIVEVERRVVIARIRCIVAGSPCICISTAGTPPRRPRQGWRDRRPAPSRR